MLKVLICDDEYSICRLIRNLINWDSLEFVGIAKDGEEGLRMIREEAPDIVITDINMPKKTGLELIQDSQKMGYDVKFILVSGYTEFEYAHTAVKYGVSSYLLKPINKEELNEVLRAISQQILTERGLDQQQKQQELDIQACRQKIRKHALIQLYHQKPDEHMDSLQSLAEEYYYQAREGCFQIVAITFDSENYPLSAMPGILEPHNKRILGGFLEECFDGEYVLMDSTAYYLLNYSANKENTIRLMCDYLLDNIRTRLDGIQILPSVGLGCAVTEPNQLEASMESAKAAVASRVLLGCGKVLDGASIEWKETDISPAMPPEETAAIEAHMDIQSPEPLVAHLSALLQENKPFFRRRPHLFTPFVVGWLRCFQECLQQHFQLSDEEQILQKAQADIQAAYQRTAVISLCTGCIAAVFQSILDHNDSSDTKIMQMVKDFVQAHYAERIELKDAANVVFLSPSYLGILFKKKTGINFSAYVTEVRLNAAKDLLRGVRYNVSEISDIVGYKDTRYFSAQFKKYTGVKPIEFRKIYHSFTHNEP